MVKNLDIPCDAPCLGVRSSSFFVDVFTDDCEPCRRILHDIPRRERARSLSQDIAHASRHGQLHAAVHSVGVDEEREVECKQAQRRVVKLGRTDSTTDGDKLVCVRLLREPDPIRNISFKIPVPQMRSYPGAQCVARYVRAKGHLLARSATVRPLLFLFRSEPMLIS